MPVHGAGWPAFSSPRWENLRVIEPDCVLDIASEFSSPREENLRVIEPGDV